MVYKIGNKAEKRASESEPLEVGVQERSVNGKILISKTLFRNFHYLNFTD